MSLQEYLEGIQHCYEFQQYFPNCKDEQLLGNLEQIKIACQNNAALCCIKLKKWQEAIQIADDVLRLDSQNTKAMMRKAEALIALQNYEEAIQISKTAYLLQPNESIKKLHEEAIKLKKQAEQKEKEMFGGKLKKTEEQKQSSPRPEDQSTQNEPQTQQTEQNPEKNQPSTQKKEQKKELIPEKKNQEKDSGNWFKVLTLIAGVAVTGYFVYNKIKAAK